MAILLKLDTPPPAPVTQATVTAVLQLQRRHCAPTTWDKFVKSLKANGFPFSTS